MAEGLERLNADGTLIDRRSLRNILMPYSRDCDGNRAQTDI